MGLNPDQDSGSPPPQEGISLNELAEAFAQVMGAEPRRPAELLTAPQDVAPTDRVPPAAEAAPAVEPVAESQPPAAPAEDDSCPVSPRTILEAMLFVGNRDNEPLSPRRAAD